MIGGVVFDMDGLMFDTERLMIHTFIEIVGEMGYALPFDLACGMLGLNDRDSARVVSGVLPPDFPIAQVERLKMLRVDAQIARDGLPVKQGLRALLAALRQRGLACAVASSSPLDRVTAYLQMAGLTAYFDALVSGDAFENSKPAPDIYLAACARIGCAPQICIALEDAPAGIVSAHAAGMIPIMIPDLVAPDASTRRLAADVLASLADVLPWIERAQENRAP